jgi:hypothetical protein
MKISKPKKTYIMKQKLLLALTAIVMLTACKKDKGKDDVSIMGKWEVVNVIEKEYVNGNVTNEDNEPGDGATIDFQDNGHAVTTYPATGDVDSVPFTLKPNNKIEIDGDEFEIRNLTSANVQLYMKEIFTATTYYEVIINLKR